MSLKVCDIFKRMTISHPFLFFIACFFFSQGVIAQFSSNENVTSFYNRLFTNQSFSIKELDETASLDEDAKGCFIYLSGLKYSLDYLLAAEYDGVLEHLRANSRVIKQLSPNTSFGVFCLGESYFHLGLIQMAQGNKLSAFISLKRSYDVHLANVKKNPDFLPSLKTLGMLDVVFSEMKNYSEFSGLIMGVKSSKEKGLERLAYVVNESPRYSFEASLFQIVLNQFVLYDDKSATEGITDLLSERPTSNLIQSLASIIYTKNNDSKNALLLLAKVDKSNPYFVYLQGVNEAQLLHHEQSSVFLKNFLRVNSNYYQASAKYYLAQSYYLTTHKDLEKTIEEVENESQNQLPADRSAKRKINHLLTRNKNLLTSQLLFDGGEYKQSLEILINVDLNDFSNEDLIERYYRLGRLYEELNQFSNSKENYLMVVFKSDKKSSSYFAPNACLHLSKAYFRDCNYMKATQYVQSGLEYRNYEYQANIKVQLKKTLQLIENETLTD
jgi:tetratricopeptide (TPR) repeat protein